ncbi:molecular chaperone HscC [Brevibacillus ginsengisoli]|uniref:molecular chaperone HscC n=1 Tax=Brevibacillus ginsengisoli TaxID=363854 RepID=UPI003CED75C8
MTTIGIDLGTTNSLVAYWTENGPAIIPNVLGENLTPSVVSVDESGEILVGQIAKERLITHPEATVAAFKRYMGTEKKYNLGKYTFTPEELSSFIVRRLKEDAEAFFGYPVTEAVISVPAYFNDAQRKSTKRGAEMAGLKVERLISEPTAAAICYGLHQQESETKFLVFDLGGGTFDVSILEMFEGVLEVKSIAGDNFLGGEDFTELLASYFIDNQKLPVDDLDSKARSAIFKQAEMCKCRLFNENSATMRLTWKEQTYEVSMDRIGFEKLVHPLIQRLRQPIERALRDAGLTSADLDAIVLIGGATRMPVIKSVISKMFGRLPFSHINPDETVALGAAIQAALKDRNEALSEVVLTDVCPYTLGVETTKRMGNHCFESGYFSTIIERNTPIPVSRVERYCTIEDNQTEINVVIFQGESRRTQNNIKLGELQIPVSPVRAGDQVIDVRFTYDINGILEVEVTALQTSIKKKMIIEQSQGTLTMEEIEKRFEELKDIKVHPRDRTANRLLLARGERLYEESLGDKREEIAFILQRFEQVLATQNEMAINKAALQLQKELESMERWHNF